MTREKQLSYKNSIPKNPHFFDDGDDDIIETQFTKFY